MVSERKHRSLKVTLTGVGYTYTFFAVKDSDLQLFTNNEEGVYLRSLFKRYLDEDKRSVAEGHQSRIVRLCTIIDNETVPAEIKVSDGSSDQIYMLRDMPKWIFVKSGGKPGKYWLNFPENMPAVYLRRLNSIFGECMAQIDKIDKEAINDRYVTYFSMYGSSDRMLLCMRTRDDIRSVFDVDIDAHDVFDPVKLCVFMRKATGLGLDWLRQYVEYDANNIVYNERWLMGEVNSRRDSNTDYFVAGAARTDVSEWYESWASTADTGTTPETNFKS